MKTQLNTELALITDPALRNLCIATLDAAPTCFWTMPASTTGNHHPDHALGPGGLIRHTKAVLAVTLHLCQMENIQPDTPTHNIAIAAALLHDSCKKADHEQHTAFDHPIRARELLLHTAEHTGLARELHPATLRTLAGCIACHMGRWNLSRHAPGIELPTPLTPLQRLIHTADYIASRRNLLTPTTPNN